MTDQVNKQLESLERCQSLEEIQKFYDNKQYQKVVDCLLQTFKQPQTKHQVHVSLCYIYHFYGSLISLAKLHIMVIIFDILMYLR